MPFYKVQVYVCIGYVYAYIHICTYTTSQAKFIIVQFVQL